MEVYKFYLTNETNLPKALIIEPLHFVEALEANNRIEIHFSSTSPIENRDLFSISIKEHTFVVTIHRNISEPTSRSITTFINEIETFKFEF